MRPQARMSAAVVALSVLAGCGWGLIAYLLGHRVFGARIWGGVAVGPLIGILIGYVAVRQVGMSRAKRVVASMLDLCLAAFCFAAAMSVFDVLLGSRRVAFPASLMEHVLAVFWGLTFGGLLLPLWPLSFVTHHLVWRAARARD